MDYTVLPFPLLAEETVLGRAGTPEDALGHEDLLAVALLPMVVDGVGGQHEDDEDDAESGHQRLSHVDVRVSAVGSDPHVHQIQCLEDTMSAKRSTRLTQMARGTTRDHR